MTREQRHKNIVNEIVDFSEIFDTFASNGRPIFSKSIPTTCICFGVDGSPLAFVWGQDFFDSCSDYKAKFILCHEMLHIFLNHGKRRGGLTDMHKLNVCMDLSINHLLIDEFGFNRSLIEDWEFLCWRDTVFNVDIKKMPSFEGYYALNNDIFKPEFSSIDSHDFLLGDEDGMSEEMKELLRKLRNKTAEYLPSYGNTSGNSEKDIEIIKSKKPKFETIIKKIAASTIENKKKKQSTWASLDRRLCEIAPDIPVIDEKHERKCRAKHKCAFFIDNSGSCGEFLQRFCDSASALNEKVFDISVYAFDTQVTPVKKINNKYKVRGGGGTCFACIEKKVLETNPDVVFVLTDGYAANFVPKDRKKYFWFLVDGGTRNFIKGAGSIYRLSQFE